MTECCKPRATDQGGSRRKKTHNQFENELFKVHPEFELLTPYVTAHDPITYRCNRCGVEHIIQRAGRLLEGRQCPTCAAKATGIQLMKSHEQFCHELHDINPDVLPMEPYVGTDKKIVCLCLKCGHVWSVKPRQLLQGHGCPECVHRKQGWLDPVSFADYMREKFPDIEIQSAYSGTGQRVKCKCHRCGYEWSPFASVLLSEKSMGCPNCSRRISPDEATMRQRVETENPLVEYVSGYIDMTHHATFRCRTCGYEWRATPSNIRTGGGCPKCNMSLGEQRIAYYLDQRNIEYDPQHVFDDCRDQAALRFDFYIPAYNFCIEYDGQQHFAPVAFNGDLNQAQLDFEQLQLHDQIKTSYCDFHHIRLLRIPYTEYEEIFNILSKYFP